VEVDGSANLRHKRKVLGVIDAEAIRARRLKVVLDSCNGAGATITPNFLRELGCEVTEIHCEPNGLFPHNPEPIFVHLQDLCAAVKKVGADIGFAQDADADRLALVNEHGEYLGEEYTLALACDYVLSRTPGPVVTNLSTTRALEDIASRYGCPLHRTRVGEVNVAERMKETASVIGGEGNGGVIDPRVHYTRDSLIGMGLVLEYMAREGASVAELAGRIPRYYMHKTKVDCSRDVAMEIVGQLVAEHTGDDVDTTDGVRVTWPDSWLHVRPSGTEPAMRVIAEAPTAEKAEALCEDVLRMTRDKLE
jgi:phosphomannomutase